MSNKFAPTAPAYTKELIAECRKFKPKSSKGIQFLHCSHCVGKLMDGKLKGMEGMSPEEAMSYYAALVPMPIKLKKDKYKIGVVVIFCKLCDRPVWDTRHLKNAY